MEPAVEERRTVTLLAADLVGSTALGERLDPEEARLVVGAALARMVTAVEELGGTVKDLAGDGIFAFFGAPTAHDDDAERAVQAGLRIAESIAEYGREVERGWGVAGFAVRVGIATGPVVLGPVGAGSRIEYGATGDAANAAARLQAAADATTVLVDAATKRIVEPLFVWGPERSLALKGKATPVTAAPAFARAAPDSRPRCAETPLVGRERELAVARDALEQVLEGAGGVLFVTGEPGIGKSRLLDELRGEFLAASSPGGRPLWLEGRAASYRDAVPYAPFQHLLRDWLDLTPSQPALRAQVTLRRMLERCFGAQTEVHEPWLGSVLGIVDTRILEEARPQEVRSRIVEAFEALLGRLAADGPVVLALDDVQWADPSSLDLVERLLGIPDREPVLLVLAQRIERGHPSWLLREGALREVPHRTREIALTPLPEAADEELLTALLDGVRLPGDLQARVLMSAGGNPFFLEELVRSLQDAGALVRSETGWQLDDAVAVAVPESVQHVIRARLDRLPAPARALVTSAAVLGRQFSLPLLEALTGVDVSEGLRELQRLDLLRETRRWPEREYAFKHPLIQETAYRSLVATRRKELHARAAVALAELDPCRIDEHAAVVAHHHLEAGQPLDALGYLRRAGDAAAAVYATDEALGHYGRAHDVALRAGARGAVAGDILLQRGRVAYRSGHFLPARTDYDGALAAARADGDRLLELQALEEIGWLLLVGGARTHDAIARLESALEIAREVGDDIASARLQSRLAIVYSHGLRFAEARTYSDQALELARAGGDTRLLATALDSAKTVSVYLGEFDALTRIHEQLGPILRRHRDNWYLQWALFESAFAPMARGDWVAAREAVDDALALNREIGDLANEPYFLAVVGWIERARGEYGSALEAGQAAVAHAAALDHRSSWVTWTETLLAWTLADLHAYDAAVDHLERGLRDAETFAAPLYVFRCAARLAGARRCRGDRVGAAAAAVRAEEHLAGMSTPPTRVFLHGADAILAVAAVRAAEGAGTAEELVVPLVAAAEQSGWLEPFAAGTRTLGELRAGAGDTAGAEHELGRALAAAQRGRLPGEEWRVHAALAALLQRDGRAAESTVHAQAASAIVDQLAAGLDSDELRSTFLRGAGLTLAVA